MSTASGLIERVRRPEYTGENRCTPCTAVNLVIATVVTAGLSVVFLPAGLAFAAVALGMIYLRGYLVPGTPTLTKRYFPDRVLRWFDKAPARARVDTDVDPEAALLELGAVEDDPESDDLRLTEGFRADWQESIADLADPATAVGALLGLDEPRLEERAHACVVRDGDREVARWPSRAALVADLGAVPALRRRAENWEELDRPTQGQLLNGLRIFLERCPDCGGDLAFSEETRESCCRTAQVVTYDCQDCEARLFEVET